MTRYLTKSRFKIAVECPRKLYYSGKKDVYMDVNQDDSFLASLADGGFQVGELAKCLYPDGIEILAKGNSEALAETADLMARENITLFEPAIAFGNYLVRVDVLIKSGNSIKLVEVKAKSIKSDDHQIESRGKLKSNYKPYIEDIAFQKYVVGLAYPSCAVTSFLLMPDKTHVAIVDQMNQLFKIERIGNQTKVLIDPRAKALTFENALLYEFNVDHYVELVHKHGLEFPGGSGSMEDMAADWARAYADDSPLPAVIGAQCANCEFKAQSGDTLKSGFNECWKEANGWGDADLAEPTVLDLWNYRGKQKLMERGVRRLAEVTRGDLNVTPNGAGLSVSERQWLQVQSQTGEGLPPEFKSAGYFFDNDYISKEMARWNYPLHFIDFETSTVALPFHIGMRPYESVAFQFSHHVMESDGTLRHAGQFLLSKVGEFPNYAFARALMVALSGDNGSVFMWASHENTILTGIIKQLQTRDDTPDDRAELIEFLETLIKDGNRAMVDLRTVAQKGYFHPSTNGSNSIKKVLPAVLESSPYLRDRYSKPIYGADDGIMSLNFSNMVWWSQDELGAIEDPYKKLIAKVVSDEIAAGLSVKNLSIAAGGDAAMAYGRLQYEELTAEARNSIETNLLRYCELDTLAMAIIVEAWNSYLLNNI